MINIAVIIRPDKDLVKLVDLLDSNADFELLQISCGQPALSFAQNEYNVGSTFAETERVRNGELSYDANAFVSVGIEKQDNIDAKSKIFEASNIEEIYKKLEEVQPDLVVTDLILQGIDGIEIVEYIAKNLPNTKSVVLTSISDNTLISATLSKGAAYYFIQPIVPENVVLRLKEIAQQKKSSSRIDEMITEIFLAIGIPPHIKGYSFLREAIKKVVEVPDIMNSVTKGIYPYVAKIYKTTPSKVERAIRHSIEVGWNRGRHDAISSVFGTRAYINEEKPTNSEFIALVAEYILFRLF